MRYLLVVGAGRNQVPVIRAAKELGCYVYVVTVAGDYPGIAIADEWIEKDIFDTEGIVDYFSDGRKPIDGVISDQSDMAVPVVAYIAEKLGLPTWGYQNALYFTNKSMMRKLIRHIGLPAPRCRNVTSLADARQAAREIGYPVVIKPTDSFSSRGITRVELDEDVEHAYYEALVHSRARDIVVEKYISGKQYFSQGFISSGKCNMFAFSDRYYYDLPDVFIPYTNAFPALIDRELKARMVDAFQRIVDELKPRFGHVWAEWIVDDSSNDLYIVEIAIRGGGAHVTTDLIPLAYGFDTQPLLVREALGEDTGFYNYQNFTNRAAAFYSFLLPEGVIDSISDLDEIMTIDGVVCAEIKDMKVGDHTKKILNKDSRYGLIVVHGESRRELDEIWEKLKKIVKIRVRTSRGIEGPIWE